MRTYTKVGHFLTYKGWRSETDPGSIRTIVLPFDQHNPAYCPALCRAATSPWFTEIHCTYHILRGWQVICRHQCQCVENLSSPAWGMGMTYPELGIRPRQLDQQVPFLGYWSNCSCSVIVVEKHEMAGSDFQSGTKEMQEYQYCSHIFLVRRYPSILLCCSHPISVGTEIEV